MKKCEIVAIVLLVILVPMLVTRIGTMSGANRPETGANGTGYETKLERDLPHKSLSKQRLPKNGAVLKRAKGKTVELSMGNESKDNLYLKFKRPSSGKTAFAGFVRRGRTATFRVPVGTWKIRYAMGGDSWFGTRGCFGSATRYYEHVGIDGKDSETYELNSRYTMSVYETRGSVSDTSMREVPSTDF